MPDLPLSERIARNLLTTVQGISTAAGYHNNVGNVIRRPQNPPSANDRDIFMYQGNPERIQGNETTTNNSLIAWNHTFAFDCYIHEVEDGDPIDTRMNTIRADIEKAVMVDPQRGGLAIDTTPADPDFMQPEPGGSLIGVTVRVIVKYRTRLNDPNTI